MQVTITTSATGNKIAIIGTHYRVLRTFADLMDIYRRAKFNGFKIAYSLSDLNIRVKYWKSKEPKFIPNFKES